MEIMLICAHIINTHFQLGLLLTLVFNWWKNKQYTSLPLSFFSIIHWTYYHNLCLCLYYNNHSNTIQCVFYDVCVHINNYDRYLLPPQLCEMWRVGFNIWYLICATADNLETYFKKRNSWITYYCIGNAIISKNPFIDIIKLNAEWTLFLRDTSVDIGEFGFTSSIGGALIILLYIELLTLSHNLVLL